ncbi:hypothetical protein ABY42_18625 (plasmid) [Haloferax gibbonsii]|uniref:ABC transmembrane type-1 domain-containing protein n=1 Tax=Haloferax gibbonsii TaxID=35746 RepID=A0A0K1J005_HALGI|nr:hypothetical protein ABY42_18625 [Haloferax gibbonsii]
MTFERVVPYLFLLPFFAIFGAFYIYPLVWAPWMSFQSFSLAGTQFVGLQNFRTLFETGRIVTITYNTVFIAAIAIPLQVGAGMVIAVVLNSQYIKLKTALRGGYLMPLVTSTTVLAIVFTAFLSESGIVNIGLNNLFGVTIPWLQEPVWARISVAIAHAWRGMGLAVLIYLAGLQGIPKQLYQAAKIDGASKWAQFRYITVPQLKPITILVLILTTSKALKLFETPYVLTDGGPDSATYTIVFEMYTAAFRNFQLGYAAAVGTVLAIMLSAIMIIQYNLLNDSEPDAGH